MPPAQLVLADGTRFIGKAFGAISSKNNLATGEVVFNTAMSGYQEILTDPSYAGQIVCMTYPLIGNYGVNTEDIESRKIFLRSLVVKELSRIASNWRSQQSLDSYLKDYGIVGITGIDTRALTLHIRNKGAQQAIITTNQLDNAQLRKVFSALPEFGETDYVKQVAIKSPQQWNKTGKYTIVAIDTGIKYNILRKLASLKCKVTLVPPTAGPEEILQLRPDGIFLANGPGDPATVPYVVSAVKALLGSVPIFGICLGHQVLGRALGAKTFKLKFGHHGANHPVMQLETGKIEITSQNHGYAVDASSLPTGTKLTHLNLNDKTCEGLENRKLKAFSVQYHPEAAPGPHDSSYLFGKFIDTMERSRA